MTGVSDAGFAARAVRLCAAGFLAAALFAPGQVFAQNDPGSRDGRPAHTRSHDEPNVFDRIGDWFDRQFSTMKSDISSAKETFDRDTDRATRKTIEAAKDAAEAVKNLPDQRTVRGRERCPVAPNGAPDCETAATQLCRSKGFGSGRSIDATTAENCPARVLLSGRQPHPGECKTETFISRALCTP